MVVACWSSKGGSGTTVVAASLAVLLAGTRAEGALVVDLVGDVPAVLGAPEPPGPGVAEWLAAGEGVPADGLARIEHPLGARLGLLARGESPVDDLSRVDLLVAMLDADPRAVIVDCGTMGGPRVSSPDHELERLVASAARVSLLVVRPCYLALRQAVRANVRPSGVVVIDEPERALEPADVGDVLQVPVVATVPVSAGVARAVDAGVLGSRVPAVLARALRRVT